MTELENIGLEMVGLEMIANSKLSAPIYNITQVSKRTHFRLNRCTKEKNISRNRI